MAYLYHALALTAEIQPRMNEWNPAHYRLFGIRTVIAPAGIQTALPPFWQRDQTIGRFDIFRAPETGYFDVVDAPAATHATKHSFYEINDRWLQSDWVEKRLHLVLDLGGPAPSPLWLKPGDPLPATPAVSSAGRVAAESEAQGEYSAEIEANRACYALFKMTWHPGWRATVDGGAVHTAMLSPGFIGVPMTPGKHMIKLRYQGSAWKLWLALAGPIAAWILRNKSSNASL